MSEGFIADSSVGVAWAVHSQASETTDELLDRVAEGTPLVVPTLWPLEVANSLLALFRRKRSSRNATGPSLPWPNCRSWWTTRDPAAPGGRSPSWRPNMACRCTMPCIWNWRCDVSFRWPPATQPSPKPLKVVASNSCCSGLAERSAKIPAAVSRRIT